ncbi:MAG: FtsW/RodA/SpoVE family cell cycle protein [Actinobacteria bacterium]|nr:FtsW/RodA/SpoVE family cell cycle protein [Actinomycetota bacterium]MDA8183936.1 FtsW/RodA/SpoVE family cell cycle protein [Actinomycetota bacterium]
MPVQLRSPSALRGAVAPEDSVPDRRRRTELGLLLLSSLLVVGAYVLASVGTSNRIPTNLVPFLCIVIGLGLLAHLANRLFAARCHPVVLPVVALLNGLGYVMIARLDSHEARLQAGWTAVGVIAYVLTLVVVRRSRDLDRYRYLLLFGGVGLLLTPLVPHLGVDINGARLWIHLGPITGQPVELAKLALCIFFASYFAEKRDVLAVPTMRVGNRLLPDLRVLGPLALAWGISMLVLGAERDVGFALLIFVLFISLLWLATGRIAWLLAGFGLFGLGTFVGSHLFAQVNERITIWLNPWPYVNGASYQLVQGLYALGTGGLIGTGLGLGHPHFVPYVSTDFIFVAFGEEMGLLGTTLIVAGFLVLVGTGLRIAQSARSDFAKLAACGLTVILGLQAFFIMAGITRLLPLTGITLPFMAYGGSSLVANYILIALLLRISDEGATSPVTESATSQELPAI